jgi:hypothetical protein
LTLYRSWDLWWPPVWAGSYWTASLQYRALTAGARLSRKIGRAGSALEYERHASMILDYLQESSYRRRSSGVDTEISSHLADVLE